MKKKLFKFLALALAVTQVASSTAFAAITSPAEDSYYYWYEDFNGATHALAKQSAMAATQFTRYGSEKGMQLTSSANASNFAYLDFATLDFSKPLVISYDVITTNSTDMWLDVCYGSGTALVKLPRLRANLTVEGYEYNTGDTTGALVKTDGTTIDYAKNAANGTKATTSAVTYATGKAINVLASLDYDSQSQILTVKQYFDGKPLLKADGTQYEYKIKRDDMEAAVSGKITLRFNVYKNTSARIDNIMVRQDSGDIDIPNGSWIDSNQAAVTFENTASYSGLATSTYLKTLNNTTNSDIEVKKYTTDDPFLLNGTEYTGYTRTNYGGSIVLGNLTINDATKDFYILKIKNKDAIKTYAGNTIKNPYSLLHSGISGATLVRETHIFDAQGTELYLTDGKFPHNASRVEFTLTSKVAQPEEADVKIGDVTATKSGNVYTVDLSGAPLVQGTEYEITVGELSKTYMTTGVNPYPVTHIQKFDTEVSFVNNNKSDISLTFANGKMQYQNTLAANATPKNVSYSFGKPFNFEKGSMIVSFDVELNQAIAYMDDGSHLLNPEIYLGDKLIGRMPAIETTGVRARNESGARVAITDAKNAMAKGGKATISTLFTYYPETNQIGYTQFVDGKRLYNKGTSEIVPEYLIENVSAFLGSNASIRLGGRNFADGGLYIDNLMMTTIDEVTIDEILTVTDSTAKATITNTVEFEDGTDVVLTKPYYINNASKEDFEVVRYAESDKLFLGGEEVTEFTYNSTDFSFGDLDNAYTYVIRLKDASKISNLSGSAIDVEYFRTSQDGILETTILNTAGEEISVNATGKVPADAAKLKIRFTKGTGCESVTLNDMAATLEDGEYVFDFASSPLAESTAYTLKVNGATIGSFATTGENPYPATHLQKFDSATAFTNTNSENIILTFADGKMQYENILAADATPKNVSYSFGKPFNFAKGSMLVSFDVELNQVIAYLAQGSHLLNPEIYLGDKLIGRMPAIETTGVRARNESGARVAITDAKNSMAKGGKATISALFTYYPETNQIGYTQFVDGKRLYNKSTSEIVPEYFIENVSAFVESDASIRFGGRNFADGGLYIDNLMVTTVDEVTIDEILTVTDSTAKATITNTVLFENGTDAVLTKPYYINNASKEDFEVVRYAESDKLFLNGEAITEFTYNSADFSFGDIENGYVYVIKLKDTTKISNLSGSAIDVEYFRTSQDGILKTTILNADGEEISVNAKGKMPAEAAKIKVRFTDGTGCETVTLNDIAATLENGEYVFDFASSPLAESTEYTLKVNGTDIGSFTTTGPNLYATAHLQNFDTEVAFINSGKDNITLTFADGRMQYENTLAADATPKNITYLFGESFDFTKGSMLVSFDVELNQTIQYLASGSYYMSPEIYLGDKLIGRMPAIEVTGVRARNESGGRVAVTDAKNSMAVGGKATISTLFTYYPDTNQIGYIQFVDGRRLYNRNTSEIVPEYFIENVSAFVESDASVRFGGRNLADGGLYIDNLAMTTINGITADDVLAIVNSTATVVVDNTVSFAEGTSEALTKPNYINNAEKSDFYVERYAADDKLLLNGEAVTDFTYSIEDFTFGNLDSTYVYVIKLSDTSKVSAINGSAIDVKYFRTGTDGISKTTILDSNGDEIFVDADGSVPSDAAKIKIRFTKGTACENVTLNDIAATLENGEYVFDFTTQSLVANAEYTLKVNGDEYGSFTVSNGAFTVSKPTISETGVCSVIVQNTTTQSLKTVYIISATYDSTGAMVDAVYEKIEAGVGATPYTMTLIPSFTGAITQKAFVWDSFSQMMPLCDETIRSIN